MTLTVRILLGLGLGLVLGLIASSMDFGVAAAGFLEPVGVLWVNAIRMTVIPLVVALLITAIAGETKGMAVVGSKTLILFVLAIAAVSFFTALVAPGLLAFKDFGQPIVLPGDVSSDVVLPPFRDWLVNLIPTNPLRAAVDGAMLPLVVFTLLFAFAITKTPEHSRQTLIGFFTALKEAMFVLIGWVMALAPIGVFALVFTLTTKMGTTFAGALGYFLLVACGLVLIGTIALYPVAAVVGKISLWKFAKACAPAQAVGFSTRSSLASLPAMFAAASQLDLSPRVTGLVLPVATSIFKYATPIARATGTYFVAALYGISLGPTEIATIAGAIALLSFYSPGIPSGALLVLTPVYTSLGLPLEGLGLLIGLDLVVDMFITMSNVTANITVAAIMDRSER